MLKGLGQYERLQSRLVQGDAITQTYQFIATGNAELGFVALSQVLQGGKLQSGSVWMIPQNLYDPIAQGAVVLKRGSGNSAAQALVTLRPSDLRTVRKDELLAVRPVRKKSPRPSARRPRR